MNRATGNCQFGFFLNLNFFPLALNSFNQDIFIIKPYNQIKSMYYNDYTYENRVKHKGSVLNGILANVYLFIFLGWIFEH